MKQLQGTLSRQPPPPSNLSARNARDRGEKWSLDPDLIETGAEQEDTLRREVQELLRRKFESEKYLEERTYPRSCIGCSLSNAPSPQPPSQSPANSGVRLPPPRLPEALPESAGRQNPQAEQLPFHAEKKEKRSELVAFQRLAKHQAPLRPRQPVFINEDDHHRLPPRTLLPRTLLQDEAKRSFGTMNSNQTESNSGKNKSGSDSRSGEGNALAVLLANVRPEEKQKGRAQKEKYEFSSLLSGSLTVRQRHHPVALQGGVEAGADQDEAFIFHRPKPTRR